MTSPPALTIDEFKHTRETRRDVLFAEYRELVRVLDKGITAKSKQAGRLDDIMVRLRISDDDLATDIEAIKLHTHLAQSIAEFETKKPQLGKQYEKCTKAIARIRSELDAVDRRFTEAQQDRHLVGQPYNKNRSEVKRKQELESRNPRIFGPIEHD